jgi:hypothetical protein
MNLRNVNLKLNQKNLKKTQKSETKEPEVKSKKALKPLVLNNDTDTDED